MMYFEPTLDLNLMTVKVDKVNKANKAIPPGMDRKSLVSRHFPFSSFLSFVPFYAPSALETGWE